MKTQTCRQHSLHHITFRSHLQLGKLLCFVAGVLSIDELGEEELVELGALSMRQTAIINEGEGLGSVLVKGNVRSTFLKIAGSGKAGPKKGTSSRAVTDT